MQNLFIYLLSNDETNLQKKNWKQIKLLKDLKNF